MAKRFWIYTGHTRNNQAYYDLVPAQTLQAFHTHLPVPIKYIGFFGPIVLYFVLILNHIQDNLSNV